MPATAFQWDWWSRLTTFSPPFRPMLSPQHHRRACGEFFPLEEARTRGIARPTATMGEQPLALAEEKRESPSLYCLAEHLSYSIHRVLPSLGDSNYFLSLRLG